MASTGKFECVVIPLVSIIATSPSSSPPTSYDKKSHKSWHHTDLMSHLKTQGFL